MSDVGEGRDEKGGGASFTPYCAIPGSALHALYSPAAQEREAALQELSGRLDRRAAELDESRAAAQAALSRRCGCACSRAAA